MPALILVLKMGINREGQVRRWLWWSATRNHCCALRWTVIFRVVGAQRGSSSSPSLTCLEELEQIVDCGIRCPASSPLAVGDKQVGRCGLPDLPLNPFLSRAVRGEPGGVHGNNPQRRRHEIWSTRLVQPCLGERFGDRHRTTIALAAPSGLLSIASAPE